MTHQNYDEIGKEIFGENCPEEWGRDRPWRVESCGQKKYKIVTKSGYRVNLTKRVLYLLCKIVNEAE